MTENNPPLVESVVEAGFASAADDYIERYLDVHELLVKHPASTFFVRVQGDSMLQAGIQTGDILVVDRALSPQDGKIVIAVINGEFTVKRLSITAKGITLLAANPSFKPKKIDPESDFRIWGVVTYVISPR